LLATGPTRSSEEGDPRAQAVQVFTNLLAEMRAYGQGVIVADQIPARLVPEVIKNTNLKVAHRLIALDDRETIATSAAMDEAQSRELAVLEPGQAAVFSGGDDAPVKVLVPPAKLDPPDAVALAERTARWRASPDIAPFYAVESYCAQTCETPEICAAGRALLNHGVVRSVFARTVLSTIEEHGALDRLWEDVVLAVRAHRASDIDERALMRSFLAHASSWYARWRGAQSSWSYSDTHAVAELLRAATLEKLDVPGAAEAEDEVRLRFREAALSLTRRAFPPFVACDVVCSQQPPLCLYREAVADLVESRRFAGVWREAETSDRNAEGRAAAWRVCKDAAYQLIEFPEFDIPIEVKDAVTAGARRTSLCFAQQMVTRDEDKPPRAMQRMIAGILKEAGL
jgi:hypothetical protein